MLGDYVLQTYEIARDKRESFRGVVIHTAILVGVTALVLWMDALRFWPWIVLLGVLHAAQDQLRSWAGRTWDHPLLNGLPAILVDQALHILVIAFIAHQATGWSWWDFSSMYSGPEALHDQLIIYGVVFIFLVWTAPVLEMETANTVEHLSGQGSVNGVRKIERIDRVMGAFERLAAVVLMAGGWWLVAPVAFVPRLYLNRGEYRNSPLNPRLITQLVVSVVAAVLSAYFLRRVPPFA